MPASASNPSFRFRLRFPTLPKEVIDETNAQKQQLLDARARLEEARRLADEL